MAGAGSTKKHSADSQSPTGSSLRVRTVETGTAGVVAGAVVSWGLCRQSMSDADWVIGEYPANGGGPPHPETQHDVCKTRLPVGFTHTPLSTDNFCRSVIPFLVGLARQNIDLQSSNLGYHGLCRITNTLVRTGTGQAFVRSLHLDPRQYSTLSFFLHGTTNRVQFLRTSVFVRQNTSYLGAVSVT